MICLDCARTAAGSACPDCGAALVPHTPENVEAMATARVRRQVRRWRDDGHLDRETAMKLEGTLPRPPASEPSAAARIEAGADAVARTVGMTWRWPPPGWASAAEALRSKVPDGEAAGNVVEAVAALDDAPAGPGLRALLNEYVWWFIGTLLVLAGSVMGVREAWRTLSGAPRQLVVAGALLTYHAAFVGLSVLVGRRSARAGRVLGGLAVGLLPVVFVALSALAAMSPQLAAAGTAGTLLVAAGTLAVVGRLHAGAGGLLLALAPSLVAQLPVAMDLDPWVRALLPAVGVVSVAIGGRRAADANSLGVFAAALYGAAALGAYALFGAPGTPGALDRDGFVPGTEAFAGVGLWGLLVAATVAFEARRPWLRGRLPHLAPTLEIGALAVVAAAALGGVAGAFALVPGARSDLDLASALAPALACVVFGVSAWRRPPAMHATVVWAAVAAVLGARLLVPDQPGWWAFAPGCIAALLLVGARGIGPSRTRALALGWGAALGMAAPVAAFLLQDGAAALPLPGVTPALATAVLVGVAAHVSGVQAMHALGAAAAAGALYLIDPVTPTWPATALGIVALVYGAVALPTRAAVFDDISLVAAILSFSLGFPLQVPWLAGAALAFRAVRDQSRLVAFAAAAALGAATYGLLAPTTPGLAALALAWIAAGCVLVAAARAPGEPTAGRWFLGVLTLPFGARGRALLDGFGAAALGFAALAVSSMVTWLGDRVEPDRPLVVSAGLVLTATALAAFVLPSLAGIRARGSSVTLVFVGLLAALTGTSYRIGRDLTPSATAIRMSIVLTAVWLLGRALKAGGPWIANRLGRPGVTPHYHVVADVGVAAIALLLLEKAYVVGAPDLLRPLVVVPPLCFLAPAVAAALLARSTGWEPLRHVAAMLVLPGVALAMSQGGVLGPDLLPLDPPGGRWVPVATEAACRADWRSVACLFPNGIMPLRDRAVLGLAAAALGLGLGAMVLSWSAALRRRLVRWGGERADLLRAWAGMGAFFVALLGVDRPLMAPALGVVALGVAYAGGGAWGAAETALATGALLAVHAFAHAGALIPAMVGIALAGASVGLVALGFARPRLAADGGEAPVTQGESRWLRLQLAALACGALGVAYALAAEQPADAMAAIRATTAGVLAGDWTRIAPPLALVAVAALLAGTQWRGAMAGLATFVGWQLGAAAAVAYLVRDDVTLCAPAVAGVALLAHLEACLTRDALARGARAGRDLLLFGLAALLGALTSGDSTPLEPLLWGMVPVTLVAAHAVWRERRPRHVYLVQSALAGGYAVFRTRVAPQWPPEADAVAMLCLGFVLVGVVVLTRRHGVPPVAAAVRRFTALLPVVAGVLLADEDPWSAAAAAAGSGLLYGALALVERSRVFGALAALAGNLALLNVAFAKDVDGTEVYLAPLGLFLILLAQLYSRTLGPVQRNRVRVIGGLLLYVPAAIKLATQVGPAADGTYAVVFGVVCLLGVAAGMALHIRAFLALGTLFFTLDVVVNLVYASLRDHRVGFLVMSVSGLLILGTMIVVTTRRGDLVRVWQAIRRRLKSWE